MSVSICHRIELAKAPMFAGRTKIGDAYYCPKCMEIRYYTGQFLFEGWKVLSGPHGFGAYYAEKKNKRAVPSNGVVPSHGLGRKDAMAGNAYQPLQD